MHPTDAAKSRQYGEFFMSPRSGKRKLRLGACSTIDELLYGRDMDYSGANPHQDFMRKFGNHAGMKSGEKPDRPFRKPGLSMTSVMDNIIWGRDMDKSGVDPHEQWTKIYDGHAGHPAGEKLERPAKKSGYAMTSVMDSVIWGRDFDRSGADPHQKFTKTYSGHAGVVTCEKPMRPAKKPGLSHASVMDTVIWGRDMDASGEDVNAQFGKVYKTHAGMRAGQRPDRALRKPGVSMNPIAHQVIWGKDWEHQSEAGGESPQEHYSHCFEGHAGRHSGRASLRKTASTPPQSGRQYGSTTSGQGYGGHHQHDHQHDHHHHGHHHHDHFAATMSDSGSDAKGGVHSAETTFAFRPRARSNSAGSLTARGPSTVPLGGAAAAPAGRLPAQRGAEAALSTGSLTSRDHGQSRWGGMATVDDYGGRQRSNSDPAIVPPSSYGRAATTDYVPTPAAHGRRLHRTSSHGSLTSRDYGHGCWAAAPNSDLGSVASSRSQVVPPYATSDTGSSPQQRRPMRSRSVGSLTTRLW